VLGFHSRLKPGISIFTTTSRTALGLTQPPIQWVPGALSQGVKRPERDADHSPPSSAESKECVKLYLRSSNTPSWSGSQLKRRDNFTFYLYLLSHARARATKQHIQYRFHVAISRIPHILSFQNEDWRKELSFGFAAWNPVVFCLISHDT
jgi:hypothetical protein